MTLEKDEKVILENGMTTSTGLLEQQSLTLTNKRLFIYKVLGLVRKKRELDYIIPIDEMEEAYASVRPDAYFEMKIRLKNNEEHNFELMLDKSDRHSPFLDNYEVIQRAITDRWVNTINNQVKRGTIHEMIFCKYCGGRNKLDRIKCANCGAVLS